MYQFLLPLSLAAAVCLPAAAQTAGRPAVLSLGHDTARPAATAAEPTGLLSLSDALALALDANADLSAAQNELGALEAAVLQAGVLPNPTLALDSQDTRRATRETTILLSQPLELGGKRAARVQAAAKERDAAFAELEAKRAEVRAAVITAFFDVLTAQERERLAQESVALAQRATAAAVRRVAAGKVSPVEEAKARVTESGVRLELFQARSELTSARQRLASLWGSLTPRFEQAVGRLAALPDLPDSAALTLRFSQSPALARARLEVDRRDALAQLERARRIPDLTVSLGVKRAEEVGRNQAIVGVSVPFPVFDQNRGNVLESLRRADKARDELLATEMRLGTELAQAFERLSATRQEVDALQKEVLPGAQNAYDAATKGYESGKFGFLEVLDAQRTLLQAKALHLRTLAEAHRAAANIDRILGAPLNTNNLPNQL
jgi:cobalt-zinc-cadmium efflux system outer membrane protein